MKVKIKKLNEYAVIPKKANETDVGFDLTAINQYFEKYKGYIEYGTGLSIEIPEGYVGLIFPRSSISDLNMSLTNSVGVIDSGYRGEIKLRFKKATLGKGMYEVGDKIGQLVIMPYPKIEFDEVKELNESDRGDKGFGSSNETKI